MRRARLTGPVDAPAGSPDRSRPTLTPPPMTPRTVRALCSLATAAAVSTAVLTTPSAAARAQGAPARPAARPASTTPARPGAASRTPASAPPSAEELARLRSGALRGNPWDGAQLGKLGAPALPALRELLADADPELRRVGAVVALNLGAQAREACPTLLRDAAAWDLPTAGAGLNRVQVREERYPWDAPRLAGCAPDASAHALATAAARLLAHRADRRRFMPVATSASVESLDRQRYDWGSGAALDDLFAAAGRLGAASAAAFRPLLATAAGDTAEAAPLTGVSRYVLATGVTSASLDSALVARFLTPALGRQWLGAWEWRMDDSLTVDVLARSPERALAAARAALAQPADLGSCAGERARQERRAWASTDRKDAEGRALLLETLQPLVRRRALELAQRLGAPGAALVADVLRQDLAAARALAAGGCDEAVWRAAIAPREIGPALWALQKLGPAAAAALPLVGEIIAAPEPWLEEHKRDAREARAALRGA